MAADEIAFSFPCNGEARPAILHAGRDGAERGVLVVVGGPQYRAGSHRQFVLLARDLAARGIPVMRFDYRGMGDAEGERVDFTAIDADLAAAIDAFMARQPALRQIVLWGLCDAASAALFYAWRDDRVTGMVLVNPWVRTESGQARAYLRHYYLQRLASADFWKKLVGGGMAWTASLKAFGRSLLHARRRDTESRATADVREMHLPAAMAEGLARFPGPIMLMLSGNDLTADEFRDTVSSSPCWRDLMARDRVTRIEFHQADHTFSRRAWRDEVARCTGDWVEAL